MKCVLSLLGNFISLKPGTTVTDIENALVQLGHEVEGVETHGFASENVVIGHLVSRVPHPNSDHLGVCQVDVGEKELRQIVCGAPNARDGLTVAVALPGAVLPGDFAIKVSKIRDVESKGMICSLRELGLGTEHNGIWEIEGCGAKPGTPLGEAGLKELPAPETVLDLSITPNRGDCFSHIGLARDLAALGLGTIKPLPILPEGKVPCSFTAATTTADCPLISLIEVKNLKNTASPAAVQAQLEAAGLRPKNALVDATNLTMILLGQPMHAYDATKTAGTTLTADTAKPGEVFEGLNDVKVTLGGTEVLIRDSAHAAGLGGILGGNATAVSDDTTHVVLEAAHFNSVRIALTGQQHQILTDARQRFERGVDPAIAEYAALFCANLIQTWCGGEISALTKAGPGVPAPQPIAYHPAFFGKFIGMDVETPRQKAILEGLGFKVRGNDFPWEVTPPTYRTYMANPEDLTEEILRVVGYDTVKPVLPISMPAQPDVDGRMVTLDRTARKAMAAAGFYEVITYSFIGTRQAEELANGATLVSISNPLAQTDMVTMRPSLLAGLLKAAAQNTANGEPTPRLAEVGKVFTSKGERLMTAGLLLPSTTRHWKKAQPAPDAYTAKAAALQVLTLLGAPLGGLQVEPHAPAHYHPGRSGTLRVGPFTLAHFGELHPAVAKAHGMKGAMAFELELEPLIKLSAKARTWQTRPYPPVLRDLAFVLPHDVTAQALLATVQGALPSAARALLQSADVFDKYVGERIPAGMQSMALALVFQSPDKTLTDGDITPLISAITTAVKEKNHGELRA